ncbi:MAG: flagellar hook-length control protein FliK [Bacteriovoracia bacterium]
MTPIQNLDQQIVAAKSAGKTAPQGANKLVGEAPVMPGDFASMLMEQVGEGRANTLDALTGKEAVVTGEAMPVVDGEAILNPELSTQLLGEAMPTSESLVHAVKPQGNMQAAPVTMEEVNWAMERSPQSLPLSTEPTPKLIDPTLIKQVNEVVLPQGAEQVQAMPAEGELLQLKDLLMQQSAKTPGRAPAIDFAKAEVDPQLMGFEDFVAQKNAVTGKTINPNAYGMPMKSTLNEPVKTQLNNESLKALETSPLMTAPQMTNAETVFAVAAPATLMAAENEAPQKVFDLQNLSKSQNLDAETVLTQVTDYIVQAKAAKEPTVNMKVMHQDLGLLDITVNRGVNDAVNIAIAAQDQGAKMFLGQHREQLMTHLSQAGVSVTDLKMEQSSNSQKDMGQSNQQGSPGHDRQFGSEQNQRREEQQRRHDLWELMREKEVA